MKTFVKKGRRKRTTRYAALIALALFLGGCGKSEDSGPTNGESTRGKREEGIFWQYVRPRIQLDPIEEKEVPVVFMPTRKGEKE